MENNHRRAVREGTGRETAAAAEGNEVERRGVRCGSEVENAVAVAMVVVWARRRRTETGKWRIRTEVIPKLKQWLPEWAQQVSEKGSWTRGDINCWSNGHKIRVLRRKKTHVWHIAIPIIIFRTFWTKAAVKKLASPAIQAEIRRSVREKNKPR